MPRWFYQRSRTRLESGIKASVFTKNGVLAPQDLIALRLPKSGIIVDHIHRIPWNIEDRLANKANSIIVPSVDLIYRSASITLQKRIM